MVSMRGKYYFGEFLTGYQKCLQRRGKIWTIKDEHLSRNHFSLSDSL